MKKSKRRLNVRNLSNQRVIINLLQWMKLKGYRSSKHLTPAEFPDTGRGIMARRDIQKDECIISIPISLLITPSVVLDSWFGIYIRGWKPQLTPMEMMTLFLVYEKSRNENSPWVAYLNSLPNSYNVCSYWKKIPDELPMQYKDSFLNQIQLIKTSFINLKPFLKFLEQSLKYLKGVMTFKAFVWGWSTVQTRSVHFKQENNATLGGNFALAPILDLFNHSPSAKVTAGFNYDTKNYEIITNTEYQKFSQIFINYGELDNAKLILNYGFYVLPNHNSFVEFNIDEICESLNTMQLEKSKGSNLNSKLELLKDRNLLRDLNCTYGEVSWSLITSARILLSDYEELQIWDRALNYSISEANENLVLTLIKLLVERRKTTVKNLIDSHIQFEDELWFTLLREEFEILNSLNFDKITQFS